MKHTNPQKNAQTRKWYKSHIVILCLKVLHTEKSPNAMPDYLKQTTYRTLVYISYQAHFANICYCKNLYTQSKLKERNISATHFTLCSFLE